jgi:hypothetical protein
VSVAGRLPFLAGAAHLVNASHPATCASSPIPVTEPPIYRLPDGPALHANGCGDTERLTAPVFEIILSERIGPRRHPLIAAEELL